MPALAPVLLVHATTAVLQTFPKPFKAMTGRHHSAVLSFPGGESHRATMWYSLSFNLKKRPTALEDQKRLTATKVSHCFPSKDKHSPTHFLVPVQAVVAPVFLLLCFPLSRFSTFLTPSYPSRPLLRHRLILQGFYHTATGDRQGDCSAQGSSHPGGTSLHSCSISRDQMHTHTHMCACGRGGDETSLSARGEAAARKHPPPPMGTEETGRKQPC